MSTLADVAEQIGAEDLFVLRQVTAGQLVNLDGVGRGKGWAGNITLTPDLDPWIDCTGSVPQRHAGTLARLLGPFWSEEAVQVPVGEYVIVFSGPGVCSTGDDELLDTAASVAWAIGEVPAEKRLADELELSQAGLTIASIEGPDLDTVATTLATQAASLLGCDFAAVLLTGPPRRVVYGERTWLPDAPECDVIAAIDDLTGSSDRLVIDQEVSASPTALHPLAFDDGLVARCAVPLASATVLGWLCCAHRIERPRGFTSLCQRVAETIGDQGTRVLARSLPPTS